MLLHSSFFLTSSSNKILQWFLISVFHFATHSTLQWRTLLITQIQQNAKIYGLSFRLSLKIYSKRCGWFYYLKKLLILIVKDHEIRGWSFNFLNYSNLNLKTPLQFFFAKKTNKSSVSLLWECISKSLKDDFYYVI